MAGVPCYPDDAVLFLLLHGLVELLEALKVSLLLLRPQLVGNGLDLALGHRSLRSRLITEFFEHPVVDVPRLRLHGEGEIRQRDAEDLGYDLQRDVRVLHESSVRSEQVVEGDGSLHHVVRVLLEPLLLRED